MGGAGMFAVSVYMVIMGGYYDKLVAAKMPAGTSGDQAINEAKKLAGPEILNTTLMIPLGLIVAFIVLLFYMRGRKKDGTLTPAV
jgi:hypothetical protein